MISEKYKVSLNCNNSETQLEVEVIARRGKVQKSEITHSLLVALADPNSHNDLRSVRIDLKRKKFSINSGDEHRLEGDQAKNISVLKISHLNPLTKRESRLIDNVLSSANSKAASFTSFSFKIKKAFYRAFHPELRRRFERDALFANPNSPRALLDGMKEASAFIERSSHLAVKEVLDRAVSLGESFQTAKDKRLFAKDVWNEIQTKFKNSTEDGELLLLPTGYYDSAGVYQPMLMSFSKKGSQLVLNEFSYGEGDRLAATEYRWDSVEIDLTEPLYQLLLQGVLLRLPQKERVNPFKQLFHFVKNQLDGKGPQLLVKNGESITGQDPIDPKLLRYHLLLACGAKENLQEASTRAEFVSEHPMDLIFEAIRNEFPDSELADKAEVAFKYLDEKLTQFLRKMPYMTKKERESYVNKFQHEIEGLNRKLIKRYGVQGKGDYLKFYHESFMKRVQLIEAIANEQSVNNADLQMEQIKELDHLTPSHFTIGKGEVRSIAPQNAEVEVPSVLSQEMLEKIIALKTSLESVQKESLSEWVDSFDQIVVEIDQMIDRNEFDNAKRLFNLLTDLLPNPSKENMEHPLFKAIFNQISQMTSRDEETCFQKLNDSFGKLGVLLLEAKLKTEMTLIERHEFLGLGKLYCLVPMLMQTKYDAILSRVDANVLDGIRFGEFDYVKENIGAFRENFSKDEFLFLTTHRFCATTPEPYRFGLVAPRLILNTARLQYLDWLNHEAAYLNFGSSPEMGLAYKSIKDYLYRVPSIKPDESDSATRYQHVKMQKDYCQVHLRMDNLWENRQVSNRKFKSETRELVRALMQGGTKKTKLSPSFVAAQTLDAVMSSLLFPRTAVIPSGINPESLKSYLRALKGGQGVLDENFKRGVELSKKLNRIELFVHYMGSATNIGIAERGSEPGCDIKVSITPGGMHPNAATAKGNNELDKKQFEMRFGFPERSYRSDQRYHPQQIFGVKCGISPEITEVSLLSTAAAAGGSGITRGEIRTIESDVEGFQEHKRCEELLLLLCNNPYVLDNPESFEHLFSLFTKGPVLVEGIRIKPEVFQRLSDLLQQKIIEIETSGKSVLGFKLKGFCTLVELAAGWIHPEGRKLPLQFNEEGIGQALSLFSNEAILEKDRYDAAAIYFFLLSQNPNWREDFTSLPQATQELLTGALLHYASSLKVVKEVLTIPGFVDDIEDWLYCAFLPYFKSTSQDSKNGSLKKWLQFSTGLVLPDDISFTDKNGIFEGGGCRVNPYGLQILESRGENQIPITVEIPLKVRSHAAYRKVFGLSGGKAEVLMSETAGCSRYRLIGQGIEWELLFNEKSLTLDIFLKKSNGETYRYSDLKVITSKKSTDSFGMKMVKKFFQVETVEMEEKQVEAPNTFEARLLENGVFVELKKGRKALALEGPSPFQISEDQLLNLQFLKGGTLKEIKKKINGVEYVLFNDSENRLETSIAPVSPRSLLYLCRRGQTFCSRIEIANTLFALERVSIDSPWKIVGGPQAGSVLVLPNERQRSTCKLIERLNIPLESLGLCIRKEDRDCLLLWPHHSLQFEGAGQGWDKVDNTVPPFEVSVDENGVISTSSGGFAQLAYLAILQKDYKKAEFFLSRAVNSKIANTEELKALEHLLENFKKLPDRSLRLASLKIKGILGIRRVLNEQGYVLQGAGESRKNLEERSVLSDAFIFYTKKLESAIYGENLSARLDETLSEVLLTGEELEEMKHISSESFDSVSDIKARLALKKTHQHLGVKAISENEFNALFQLCFLRQGEPLPRPQQFLNTLSEHPEGILNHFFDLWNLIALGKLSKKDLFALFPPIRDEGGFVGPRTKEFERLYEMNLARRALISYAEHRGDSDHEIVNIAALRKLQKQLPTTALGVVRKLLVEKSKMNQVEQTLLDSTLETMADYLNFAEAEDLIITPEGVESGEQDELEKMDKALLEQMGRQRLVRLDKLREALRLNPALFGKQASQMVEKALHEEKVQELFAKSPKGIPASIFVERFEQQTGINLVEALRIGQIEARLESAKHDEKSPIPPPQFKTTPQVLLEKPPPFNQYFQRAHSRQKEHMDAMIQDLEDKYARANANCSDDVREALNRRLQALKAAELELKEELDQKKVISPDKLMHIKAYVSDQIIEIKNKRDGLLDTLFSRLGEVEEGLPKSVREALKNRNVIGDDELLYILKREYQRANLSDSTLESTLTSYLILESSFKMMERQIVPLIEQMEELSYQKSTESLEWASHASKLSDMLDSALDFHRYRAADGSLKDHLLSRKLLVLEAHMGLVTRPEQLKLIQSMIEHPDGFYELKVGMGKTSVVFPVVLLMLLERGICPTALVKDALLQQNLDSLDRSTRDLLESAGVAFVFNYNKNPSVLELKEELLRIVEVKNNRGYPITTRSSLLSLLHERQRLFHLLQEVKQELFGLIQLAGHENPLEFFEKIRTGVDLSEKDKIFLNQNKKLFDRVSELREKIELINEIHSCFNPIIADEVDDICNPVNEFNIGIGQAAQINRTAIEVTGWMMEALFEHIPASELSLANDAPLKTDQEINAVLGEFGRMVIARQQAAIDKERLNKLYIKAMAMSIYRTKLPEEFRRTISEQDFVDYLCTDNGRPIRSSPEAERILGSLNVSFHKTIRLALAQRPGIDMGIKKDGFQVGPRVAEQECVGTVYGTEDDVVMNHFIAYALELPNSSFIREALDKLELEDALKDPNDPMAYPFWKNAAGEAGVIAYLNKRENWRQRLSVLYRAVFEGKAVVQNSLQWVLNVQELTYGKNVGGMTGTLDAAAMPIQSLPQVEQSSTVTSRVHLELGLIKAPQVHIQEPRLAIETLRRMVQDKNCKAIVNQGFDLGNMTPKEVVARLRVDNPDRIFIFIDPETRQFMIWDKGDEPRRISKLEMNEKLKESNYSENVCVYFAPADTRGTDVKLPPGYAVNLISEKCSEEDLVQTLGRMRGAGLTQHGDIMISPAVEKRIRQKNLVPPNEPITYGAFILDHQIEDNEASQSKRLTACVLRMEEPVLQGTREIIQGGGIEDIQPLEEWQILLREKIADELSLVANDPETGWLTVNKRFDPLAHLSPVRNASVDQELIGVQAKLQMERIKSLEKKLGDLSLLQGMLQDEQKPWFNAEIERIKSKLKAIKNEVNSAIELNRRLLGEHYLNHSFSTSGSSMGQMQAQVTQQQQQQQQQQTEGGGEAKGKLVSIKNLSYSLLASFGGSLPMSNREEKRDVINFMAISELTVSMNFNDLFGALGGVAGHPGLAHIIIDNTRIGIITRQEYQLFISEKNQTDVWSLVPTSLNKEGIVLLQGSGENLPKPLDLAFAKILIGSTDFTALEIKAFKAAWMRLEPEKRESCQRGMMSFIKNFGTDEQRRFMMNLITH